MKITKLNNISGFCNNCGKQIDSGYLYQQSNGEAFKVICDDCFLAEEQGKKKSQRITVKEEPRGLLAAIFSLFGVETRIYKVLTCEDPFIPNYITIQELNSLRENGATVRIHK